MSNALIFWAMCGTGLLVSKRLGSNYPAVFCVSLFVRQVVVLLMTWFPPVYTRAITDVPAIFPDEVYYTDLAFAWSHSPIPSLRPSTQYELVAAYMSVIYRLAGRNVLWGRLAYSLIGSLTSVFIYDAAVFALGRRGQRAAFWMSAVSPVLILWSSVLLKEALFSFGVALLVASAARVQNGKRHGSALALALLGGGIVYALREFAILFAALPFIWTAWSGVKRPSTRVLTRLIVLIVVLSMIPLGFADLRNRLAYAGGTANPLDAINARLEWRLESEYSTPVYQFISATSRSVQILAAPFVLLLTPVPTTVLSLLESINTAKFWQAWMAASRASEWWLWLPLLVIGVRASLQERDVLWRAMSLTFFAWYAVAAYGGGVLGTWSTRIREEFVVFSILLACRGFEWIGTRSSHSVRVWQARAIVYYTGLVTLSFLYVWGWPLMGSFIGLLK